MSETESIQINLNSKFASKYINGSKSNCIFDIPAINIPSQHHIHISVLNATIPYSFYNINGSNNLLYYIINGTPNTLLVKPGNYNSNQLCVYLNQTMTGFTCSYNSIYNKFTIKNNAQTDFVIASFSTLLKLIGFEGFDDFVSANYELTSNLCSNLNTNNHCIHIKSNFITGNINSNNYYVQDTLTTIPINSPPNSLIVYNSMQKNIVNLYSNILNDIQIKLVNQDDIILDLNGLDWSITLQLDIVDFVN